jgi:hypothetical protein
MALTRDAAGAIKALKGVPQSKKATPEFKLLWDKMQHEVSIFEQVISCADSTQRADGAQHQRACALLALRRVARLSVTRPRGIAQVGDRTTIDVSASRPVHVHLA